MRIRNRKAQEPQVPIDFDGSIRRSCVDQPPPPAPTDMDPASDTWVRWNDLYDQDEHV